MKNSLVYIGYFGQLLSFGLARAFWGFRLYFFKFLYLLCEKFLKHFRQADALGGS